MSYISILQRPFWRHVDYSAWFGFNVLKDQNLILTIYNNLVCKSRLLFFCTINIFFLFFNFGCFAIILDLRSCYLGCRLQSCYYYYSIYFYLINFDWLWSPYVILCSCVVTSITKTMTSSAQWRQVKTNRKYRKGKIMF